MSDKSIAEAVHKLVFSLFIYLSDEKKFDEAERWDEYAAEVERGEEFTGDCDAFALTCLIICKWRGIDAAKLRMIFCKAETGGNHLVCAIDLEDDTLILDNRYKWVMSAGELPRYEFIKGRGLNDKSWRRIT
jgi:predicted transglutaminase-like cysteine proteinase